MPEVENITTYADIINYEIDKCRDDMLYFVNKYCYIQHPIRGRIKFDLYDFQNRTLDAIKKNKYVIILKSRQLGISTLLAARALHMALFNKDKTITVVATKQSVAVNIITKVKMMYDTLPTWILNNPRFAKKYDNRQSLVLKNGSVIHATSSSADATRSEALTLAIIDECAFIDNFDEKWPGIQQTLATGGDAVVLSTPNGTANWFYRTWTKAIEGDSLFFPVKLKWNVHPERDKSWRNEQDELLGEDYAGQECIDKDCLVTIKNAETGNIEELSIGELYER